MWTSYGDFKSWFDKVLCEEAHYGCHNSTSSAMPDSSGAWQTATSEVLATSSLPLYTTTSLLASSAGVPEEPIASNETPTALATPITMEPTAVETGVTSTETAAMSQHSSEAPALRNNARQVAMIFGCGLLAAVLIYIFVTVEIRFFQFIRNAFRLLGVNSFQKDREMGLQSESFDVHENIEREDQRLGLGKLAKLRVLWYMFIHGETFDEARLRYVQHMFAANGISPDGQPLDPKFVRYD